MAKPASGPFASFAQVCEGREGRLSVLRGVSDESMTDNKALGVRP